MLEALIIATCITEKYGCSEATSAYYLSNKQLQDAVKNVEKISNKFISNKEYLVYIATPIYTAAIGQQASFKIYNSLMFNLDLKHSSVGVQWNW